MNRRPTSPRVRALLRSTAAAVLAGMLAACASAPVARIQRGATAVMPYSARAKEGAPVAAPIAWEELGKYQSGAAFSIRDADQLTERAGSKLLAGWGQARQRLPKA